MSSGKGPSGGGGSSSASADDQQFCLRWNNFQANITSQFEHLRDEEDFTDVTIACEGQQLQAHKIVLSACSPLFKEMFKSNPCPHPIIFMRDVEAQHIVALMEFMYAGEVNVAQAQLSNFLKTAESLKIRGLTDTSSSLKSPDEGRHSYKQTSSPAPHDTRQNSSVQARISLASDFPSSPDSLPPSKRNNGVGTGQGKTNSAGVASQVTASVCSGNPADGEANDIINSFLSRNSDIDPIDIRPKIEIPDVNDDEMRETETFDCNIEDITEFAGGMEIIAQPISNPLATNDASPEMFSTTLGKYRGWARPFLPCDETDDCCATGMGGGGGLYGNSKQANKRCVCKVKLGEGIEIYEDQLRSVKWSDYRKLTRGLATILFSPTELATCSVTGQRWSRAGSGERPVKPALDRNRVQAIISYVSKRFPSVEISRIKQVLAYKCKENSTAFKMKAVRYYGKNQRGNTN